AGFALFENSKQLLTHGRISYFIVKWLLFFFSALALSFCVRKKIKISFEMASAVLFSCAALYLSIRLSILPGVLLAGIYIVYLVLLGRFCVAGMNKLLGVQLGSAWETGSVSFIYGVLLNYILWYFIGIFGYLHPPAAAGIIGGVVLAGGIIFRKEIKGFSHRAISAASLTKKFGYPYSIFFNIILFSLLLLLIALSMRLPGHEDSSARMYLASVFRFCELHRIEFLPFSANWPLIFQPLMMEITGAPLYLAGGLPALRLFYGFCYFSFIPFLILLGKRKALSGRFVVLVLFLYISSSFTFRMAFTDKPEVMAFPALISLFAVCVLTLKEARPWCILSIGPLCAIIFSTKPVLIAGAFFALLFATVFKHGPGSWRQNREAGRKTVFVSLLVFFFVCAINPIQNMILRGNPLHPFAENVFLSSKNFPEETSYTKAPGTFYKATMPTVRPAQISGLNLDVEKGLYRPRIPLLKAKKIQHGHTLYTINIITVLFTVLLPILLLIIRGRTPLFCAFTAMMSFLVWFCWIGDGLRYAAYFPAIVLFGAFILYKPFWPLKWMNVCWSHAIYIILIFSVPLSVYASLKKYIPRDLQRYPFHAGEAPASIQPFSHPVAQYLKRGETRKPVLLVSDMEIVQYGFFQPNFTFSPEHMNMVSLSRLRPTHFLTPRPLDKSELIVEHPFLNDWLELEKSFQTDEGALRLHRFDIHTPWDAIFQRYKKTAPHSPALVHHLESFYARYAGENLMVSLDDFSTGAILAGMKSSGPRAPVERPLSSKTRQEGAGKEGAGKESAGSSRLFFPFVSNTGKWDQEIGVVNRGRDVVRGEFIAHDHQGNPVGKKLEIELPPRGRREVNAARIVRRSNKTGWILFQASPGSVVSGYYKSRLYGRSRMAAPAVSRVNTGDLLLPHIPLNEHRAAGVSLVNTMDVPRELTLALNDGRTAAIRMGPREHLFFTIKSAPGAPDAPGATCGVLRNGAGVVGMMAYSGGADNGIWGAASLSDQGANVFYLPYFKGYAVYTELAIFNPSGISREVAVSAYDAKGRQVAKTVWTIPPMSRHFHDAREEKQLSGASWVKVSSDKPMDAFAWFGDPNGEWAAGVSGISAGGKQGVFPKIEKDSHNSLALINPNEKGADVKFLAMDDEGVVMDRARVRISPHKMTVLFKRALFTGDIRGATYISYTCDKEIAAYNISISTDQILSDAMPSL
ncbi:MAG: hypothetical protein GY859_25960, partial [Desulfobacterales bacterium]|nr:hypothetical protein [Desulfobacterales bacterium]